MQNTLTYEKWRRSSPHIYDFIFENSLEWPCTSCRWGPITIGNQDYIQQKLYIGFRTDGQFNEQDGSWKRHASYIVVCSVDIPGQGGTFNYELNSIFLKQESKKCPLLNGKQVIVHPGEVNTIRVSHYDPKWIASHSDSKHVYVWNLEKCKYVPNYKENIQANIPDITLIGHTDTASYALDWSRIGNNIASGGKDKKVLVWDADDYQSRLTSNYLLMSNKRELSSISTVDHTNIRLSPREELKGHTAEIEGVAFCSTDKYKIASVGDDKKLIVWDTRTFEKKAIEFNDLHDAEINCVDWNLKDDNYIATGANDGTAHIIDIRMQKEVYTFSSEKKAPVHSIQFCPQDKDLIGIGSDYLQVYQYNNGNKELKLTHAGHKANIVDFEWNQYMPWTFVTGCDESENGVSGGGSLHIFRPIDLIYLPQEEAINRLSNFIKKNQK